ncbi:MAG TPA: hypothetical protein VGM23_09685 [Armatimonadota bacterium]
MMATSFEEYQRLEKEYEERFGEEPDTFSHCGLGPEGLADAMRQSLATGQPLLQTPDLPKGVDI